MKFANFMLLMLFFQQGFSQQNDDAFLIKEIFDHTLTDKISYNWLKTLTMEIGSRLSGSPQAAAAVEYTYQVMDTIGLDTVWKQPVEVPHWHRGEPEIVRIINSSQGSLELNALALGNSRGTGPEGLHGEVIEVQSLDEVDALGPQVEGKIVFYNRPMDPTFIRTFFAYGGAVDQRGSGASKASEHGAIAVLVRSMASNIDDIPHTGGMYYKEGVAQIPALAISTKDAELLSKIGKNEPVQVYMRNTSRMLNNKMSYNVIGEIRGSTYPDEIIVVGGHLDSWDVGQGAHDDGTGCVHAIESVYQLLKIGYQPKRTIRCVMFMNEENGLAGGREYARVSNELGEFHLAAIESDAGGFSPRGFRSDATETVYEAYFGKLKAWETLLAPYGLHFSRGGSGADISPLKSQNGLLLGLNPDSQRYFDIHHTSEDTFDKVNQRELALGSAAMASLIYLIDKYGLED